MNEVAGNQSLAAVGSVAECPHKHGQLFQMQPVIEMHKLIQT